MEYEASPSVCQAGVYSSDRSQHMPKLAEIIQQIRKATGISQANLARFLGVDQTAVSQWERQQTEPSTDVLLILHSLADTENQIRIRQALLDRLDNITPSELDSLLTNLQRHGSDHGQEQLVGTVLSGVIQRRKRIRPFLEEAQKLVESGLGIHPALPQIIKLYRENADLPGIRNVFWMALGYVDMEIQKRSTKATPRQRRQKGSTQPTAADQGSSRRD